MTCEENHEETITILEGQVSILEDTVSDLKSQLEEAENEVEVLRNQLIEADDDLDTALENARACFDELRKTLIR